MRGFNYINKKKLGIYFVLFIQIFPIVVPMGLNRIMPSLYKVIYGYWQKASFLFIALLFISALFRKRKNYASFRNLLLLIMPCYVLFLTVFRGGRFSAWYSSYVMPVIIFMLLFEHEKDLEKLIFVFLIILKFWLAVNLASMIIHPEGLYYVEETKYTLNWILGYKSSLQYYILPLLCFQWIICKYDHNMSRFYIWFAVSAMESLIGQNTMLTIGLAIYFVIIFFNLYRIKWFSSSGVYAITVIANVLLLFINEVLVNNKYWKMLLKHFGKTVTLSSRTVKIWPGTIQAIRQHWFLGHGVLSAEQRITIGGGFAGATHAHNQLLEFMFVGGIVMVVLFIVFNIMINRVMVKNYDYWSAIGIMVSLFIIFLMVTVEVFTTFNGGMIWLVFGLALYSKEMNEQFMCRHRKRNKKVL